MAQFCKNGCGRQTSNHDGICVICSLFVDLPNGEKSTRKLEAEKEFRVLDYVEDEKKEEDTTMGKHKACQNITDGKECGRPVQKEGLCYKCYKLIKGHSPCGHRTCSIEGCNKYAVKKGKCTKHSKEDGKTKSEVEVNPLPSEKAETDKSFPCACETYIIPVDFSRYPKLHEHLIKMAETDFRTPGMQLLSMVHRTLSELEAKA